MENNSANYDWNLFELEDQFILRLPEKYAKTIQKCLKRSKSSKKLKKLLKINLNQCTKDIHQGFVYVKKKALHAKLVNLPCIIESLKTIDKIHFFKTADICQMLICREDEFDSDDEYTVKKGDVKKLNRKYTHLHGITPSLKNVRKTRFRKILRYKGDLEEMADIEKEVLYLLREDNDAVSTRFEIFYEDTPKIPISEIFLFGEEISDSEENETAN